MEIEKNEIVADENGCFLNSRMHQCCCDCVNHLPDHYHCTTAPDLREQIEKFTGKNECICSIRKGWTCIDPCPDANRVYTNWPEHSIGCELYESKAKKKGNLNGKTMP